MTEETEETKRLQAAWDWSSNEMTKYVVGKEVELGAELFFPIMMVCVDALRLRGLKEDEIIKVVTERTTIKLEKPAQTDAGLEEMEAAKKST